MLKFTRRDGSPIVIMRSAIRALEPSNGGGCLIIGDDCVWEVRQSFDEVLEKFDPVGTQLELEAQRAKQTPMQAVLAVAQRAADRMNRLEPETPLEERLAQAKAEGPGPIVQDHTASLAQARIDELGKLELAVKENFATMPSWLGGWISLRRVQLANGQL